MALVWKYRRGKVWYLAYAAHLNRPAKSLRTDNSKIAETIRAKQENDLLLGQYGIKQGPVKSISWSQFVLLFLRHKQAGNIKPGTVRTYTLSFNAFGIFLSKDVKINKITSKQIEDFILHRREKKLKEKSIRNDVMTISTAFRWAVKEGYARESPCVEVEKPRAVKKPPDYLKESEYLLLNKGIKDPFLRNIVDFYILTGCRRGEGIAIMMNDIDLKNRILHIGQPKQSNYRTIPIGDELKEVIKRLQKQAGKGSQLIPLTGSAIYNRFKRALAKTSLKRNVRLHSLRHTFGTWLGSKGAAPRNLQDLMGHSSLATTAIYTHPMSEPIRRDLNKLKLPKKRKS